MRKRTKRSHELMISRVCTTHIFVACRSIFAWETRKASSALQIFKVQEDKQGRGTEVRERTRERMIVEAKKTKTQGTRSEREKRQSNKEHGGISRGTVGEERQLS